jgi:cathepsin L
MLKIFLLFVKRISLPLCL